MALTLAGLRTVITHALGGGDPAVIVTDVTTTKDQIVNEAGRFLCTMHQWKFLERPPTSLDFTAATAYVPLPSDFMELIAYSYSSALTSAFQLTTFQSLAMLRAANLNATAVYYGCIVQPTQVNTTTAPPIARLELYPTPASTITAALNVWYRAGWTEFAGGGATTVIANIPTWAETLLITLIRAFARGYEEDRLEELVSEVAGGPVFQMAKDRDGLIQPDYGQLNMQRGFTTAEYRFPYSTVGAPS
jgi:hypothetical protein